MIFRSFLKLSLLKKKDQKFQFSAFEQAHIVDSTGLVHFLVIYRPPPSSANGLRVSDFLSEFETFTNEVSQLPGHVIILGDFNMHVDNPSKSDVAQFLSIIESARLSSTCQWPDSKNGSHT